MINRRLYDNRISTHVSNDEWRLYEFTRNSRIPWGTFDSHRIGNIIIGAFGYVGSIVLIVMATLGYFS